MAVVVACGASRAMADDGTEQDRRLAQVRVEIERLRTELGGLESRERTTLGEIERLSAEIRLRAAELSESSLQIEALSAEVEERDRRLAELREAQGRRAAYLAFRLRETYKCGPVTDLRRIVGGEELDAYLPALRYAAYLGERDARILGEYRAAGERLAAERDALASERALLDTSRTDGDRRQARLAESRSSHARALEEIRADRAVRRQALSELETAAAALSKLVTELPASGPVLDVRKFKGLLDWPASGTVGAGFGDVVHPRFKTVVPHPGLDIDAPADDTFRSVFDGTVLFAAWLHGYGLTAIVDHGDGVTSIYAHASVLVVQAGDPVVRGQPLGTVGETGSLRGPYLYLEIRDHGAPVDPRAWLRRPP
jgi:septal ring factor EnvC (AmiA/AmiB activator)